MSKCRVDLLPPDEAKSVAEAVKMIPAFADLNIFRVLLHRPKTAKSLSDLLVSLLFGGELEPRFLGAGRASPPGRSPRGAS